MDNDMDVGAPVEAVNESPEVKAEKQTRPKKKTVKNAPAKPVSRTTRKPSSRAVAQMGWKWVQKQHQYRFHLAPDPKRLPTNRHPEKKTPGKPVAKMNRNAPKNRKNTDKNDAGNVFPVCDLRRLRQD